MTISRIELVCFSISVAGVINNVNQKQLWKLTINICQRLLLICHPILSCLDKSNFLKVSPLFYDEQSCKHQHLLGISRADLISDRLRANSVRWPEPHKTSGFGKNRIRSFIKVNESTIFRLSHEAHFSLETISRASRKTGPSRHRGHDTVVKLEMHPRRDVHDASLI